MKKQFGAFILAVCMLSALAVPAYAAETCVFPSETMVVSMDDMLIPIASITDATITKQSLGNEVYEFELGQQIDTIVTNGQEEIICTKTKIIAVGEDEARHVEEKIQELQRMRGTVSGTASGSYLGGSASLQCIVSLVTLKSNGTTYYKLTNLNAVISVESGITYERDRVDFFANGYTPYGNFQTQRDDEFFHAGSSQVRAPGAFCEIKESYDADIGGIYYGTFTKNGRTTAVSLANYYF